MHPETQALWTQIEWCAAASENADMTRYYTAMPTCLLGPVSIFTEASKVRYSQLGLHAFWFKFGEKRQSDDSVIVRFRCINRGERDGIHYCKVSKVHHQPLDEGKVEIGERALELG